MVIIWIAWLRRDHFDYLNVPGFLTDVMGLVVAFIPEGMPMAVALTFSLIARRMRDVNILPKTLSAVETLGCVNVVCSDKTGTLTENKMSVVSIGFVDRGFALPAEADHLNEAKGLERTKFAMAVCNDSVLEIQVILWNTGQSRGTRPMRLAFDTRTTLMLLLFKKCVQFEEQVHGHDCQRGQRFNHAGQGSSRRAHVALYRLF